jgi:hypothetical protein
MTVDGHPENWPLTSGTFRRWLKRQFFEATGKASGSQALQDALGVLEGQAIFSGEEYAVFTRLAEYQGVIYLDLANKGWEMVEITSTGWQVVSESPVKFRRSVGIRSLPCPMKGGSTTDLRPFVNVASDGDWTLLLAWLVAALRLRGPYPILVLHGEPGSAKTTVERVLRALVDPNSAPTRAEPKEGRDLMIAATNGWVVALDNVSHLPPWLSDALCRLATGGGFATRQLYSDDGEAIFYAMRPVMLNGIEELATKGDLLDRAIVVYLPTIPEEKRRSEEEFWAAFDKARPVILGALLDAVAHALAHLDGVKLDKLPRMADFALWACAADPALGSSSKDFIAAYTGNRESANELTLEASPIVPPVRQLVVSGEWTGTATQLLDELNKITNEVTRRQKAWPSNGQAVSNALRRVVANLRATGVEVIFHPRERRRRLITIRTTG